jgi:hypothetical protein
VPGKITPTHLLDIETLRKLIDYNPDTGVLCRRFSTGGIEPGPVTSKDARGYIKLRILGIRYAGHRVAFFWMTGRWPTKYIDHINGVLADNSWSNLREASATQNNQNIRVRRNSMSRCTGVVWCNTHSRWRARISLNGKQIALGYFKCLEAAIAARKAKELELFGEFAPIRDVI